LISAGGGDSGDDDNVDGDRKNANYSKYFG
jgi:hypothetical protein